MVGGHRPPAFIFSFRLLIIVGATLNRPSSVIFLTSSGTFVIVPYNFFTKRLFFTKQRDVVGAVPYKKYLSHFVNFVDTFPEGDSGVCYPNVAIIDL